MIVREGPGKYREKLLSSDLPRWRLKRDPDDWDLAFGEGGKPNHRVYIIDENEWFDPHTSSKYEGGVSRHAMYGPSVIHLSNNGGSLSTVEYHVNDPVVWAWIRRVIAEGWLSKETLAKGEGVANHENEVEIDRTAL